MNTKALARAALGMGAVTAGSRAFGFVRVLVVAAVLGTTFLGNTFQGANSVSNVLFELLAAGALSAVLVPTFVRLLDAGEDAEADRLASGLLGYALVVLGVVSIVGIICAPLAREVAGERCRERPDRRAATRAGNVPAALLRAAGDVLRLRRGCNRGPLRAPPVRDHRGGTDRQHAGDGRGARRVSDRDRAGPDLRPVDRRAVPPRVRGHGRRARVRRDARHRGAPLRLLDAAPLGRTRCRVAIADASFDVGSAPAHERRSVARGGDHRGERRGRRRGRVSGGMGVLPRSLRGARPTHPHRDPARDIRRSGPRRPRWLRATRCSGRSTAWRSSSSRSPRCSSPSRCR